ncbi:hypothetical protein Gotur_006340 [Gossypium turneri]
MRWRKKLYEHVEPRETHEKDKKANKSRDMQSTLEGRVAKLEGSIGGVRETFKRNDRSYGHGFKGGTKAMMTRIEELEGELTVCRAIVGKGIMALILEQRKMDVPKSKEFKETRFTDERRGDTVIGTWMEFQNKFRRKFYRKHAKENAQAKLCQLMQQDTVREYVREFPNLSEKEAFYLFNDGFKPSTKQELHRLRVKELTKAISKAECFLELGEERQVRVFQAQGDGLHMMWDFSTQTKISAINKEEKAKLDEQRL